MVLSSNKYFGANTYSEVVEEQEISTKIYKKFISFIDACERFVYENKNIVVAIDELDLVMNVIDSFGEEFAGRIKKHLQQKVEKLLELGNALNVYKLEIESDY